MVLVNDLTLLLSQECQGEMSAHQATLDYVNQPFQVCGSEEGQMERYKHNRFAEDQGCLNHRWLTLQENLNSQVRKQLSCGDSLSSVLWLIRSLLNSFKSVTERIISCVSPVGCSDSEGGAGFKEQSRAYGQFDPDQQLGDRSEPLDRLSSDTQQPDRAAEEHQHLPGGRSQLYPDPK